MATRSDSLLNRSPRTPHILNCQRGIQGEVNQLWLELEHLSQVTEGRVAFPEIDRMSVSTISAAAGAAAVLVEGRGLIPVGWSRAVATINPGVNMGIDWFATQPGTDGNNLRIVYAKGGGALAVAYAAGTRTVTVTLAVGGSTPAAIIAAAALVPAVYAQVNPQNIYGSTAAGVINVAVASTALAGGTGTAMRRAFLTIDPAGANNVVRFTARQPGPAGNSISVAYTVGVVGAAPIVTVTGQAISVSIDAGVTTANDVIAAVMRHTVARRLVTADRTYGSTGAGTLPGAVAAAVLANGADGQGIKVEVGGLAGVIFNITDETFSFDIAALAEQVATEETVVAIDICGHAFRIPLAVAA